MNGDFRLAVNFRRHRKTRKLKRELGHEGVLCLIWLFSYAAEMRPDGRLTGLTPADIEEEVEWGGKPRKFYEALVDIGWLEEEEGDTTEAIIHEWSKWNPWAAGFDARSKAGRKNAMKRWHPAGMPEASDGNAPTPLLSVSSPTPTPEKKVRPRESKAALTKPEYDPSFNSVWKKRREDPGSTSAGSKTDAWEEWKKLDIRDKNECGLALFSLVDKRIAYHKKHPDRELENIPHLFRWIKKRGWDD